MPSHPVTVYTPDWLSNDPVRTDPRCHSSELPRRGVKIISVEITADEAVIESRIASKQRLQFKKLTDVVLYRQLRDSGVFTTPLIPRTDLRVDTGKASPAEAARQIASHSRLI